jgi:two-component system, sensor histidine kinase
MALLLRVMSHDVQFAINGCYGCGDVARRFRPEVILLDIGLPDFRGDEIARQLKFEPGLERMRIIAVTGRSDEETQHRVLETGCEALCVKPLATLRSKRLWPALSDSLQSSKHCGALARAKNARNLGMRQ